MWLHRRSEEPSCTSVECYWKKSKLSRVGSSMKYMTAKELSKGNPILPANSLVLEKFLEEARKRKLEDCELIKYQPSYSQTVTQAVSMHQLVYEFKNKSVEDFLKKVQISPTLIKQVEEETREQSESDLWFQLRYGQQLPEHMKCRCKTNDAHLYP
ncbi:hypothetical protein EVAR_78209_1 [Eumeta japonica]|uniref:Uncharacterized protein n=1 Tax=Eumeta variegata TaxID=151549 RepID=A0A4C2A292_EUMVA|nr:hypothetical protein EVAR_78209_1 [Eumeta japonica]